MSDKNENYKVYDNGGCANIFISNRVVEEIAAIAALDVDGIAIEYNKKQGREIAQKKVKKVLHKGIKAKIQGTEIFININIDIIFGYNIIEVSNQVQEKVRTKVEDMTSMKVRVVNVTVNSVR